MGDAIEEHISDILQAGIEDKTESKKTRASSLGVVAVVKACKPKKKDGSSRANGRDSPGVGNPSTF